MPKIVHRPCMDLMIYAYEHTYVRIKGIMMHVNMRMYVIEVALHQAGSWQTNN